MTALVLPITLTEFNANRTDDKINLAWKTASERNNHFFEIERSSNSVSWKKIATVQGSGNSDLANRYQFQDNTPANGANYYRLKQVDFDGKFSYSKIALATFEQTTTSIRAFPNPFNDKMSIALNGEQGIVQIFDVQGKLLLQKETTGGELLDCSTETFAKGVYFVTIRTEENSTTLKMVKN